MDTLITDDPYITLNDSAQDYGDIPAEADSLIEGAFEFTVSDSVPDQHNVSFTMQITGTDASDNEYTWESDFSVTLNAPELEIGDLTIDDASGNGDGILDPGETADLVVEVSNTGHSDISGVEGDLNTSASELTINTGSDGPYSIAAGATETLTFSVTADGSTPIGTPVDVEIDAAGGDNNYTDAATKQLVIGEIPEYLISDEGTVSTCVGLFYDSGGPDGEYSNDESYTMTFEPSTSGNVIQAEFLSFDVEGGYDWLKVYDGGSTSADMIGTYDNDNTPNVLTASNAEGTLTFEFYSDGYVTKAGWEAEISCVDMNEVVFSVTDGADPIENAEVDFAGSTVQTDASGEAAFVVEAGTYDYTVSKTGYDNTTGTLDVSADMTENVTLNISTYDITFNLYEEDGSTPIDGDITFDGSTVTTTDGSYTFTDVEYA
ncbi:MAG: CUB domain-containing protein, partial [Kiritimatiellia bacterium]